MDLRKPWLFIMISWMLMSIPAIAATNYEEGIRLSRWEIGLCMGMKAILPEGSSTYSDHMFSNPFIKSIHYAGTLNAAQNPLFARISVSRFFGKFFGIQLGFNLSPGISRDAGKSLSQFETSWTFLNDESARHTKSWPVNGAFSLNPISLNCLFRIPVLPRISAGLSAGLSYARAQLHLNSSSGVSWAFSFEGTEYADFGALPINLETNKSVVWINTGGFLDFRISRRLAVGIDATYFHSLSGAMTANWTMSSTRTYGNLYTGIPFRTIFSFNDVFAKLYSQEVSEFKVKLSQMRVGMSMKIFI